MRRLFRATSMRRPRCDRVRLRGGHRSALALSALSRGLSGHERGPAARLQPGGGWMIQQPKSSEGSVMRQLQGIGNVVRNSVVGTVRGTGEVFQAVTETVSNSLVVVLRGTGAVGGALTG